MAKRGETDWQEVERRYIEGGDGVTLAVLARDVGCREDAMRRRSSCGDWTMRRSTFRAQVAHVERAKTAMREGERRSVAASERVAALEDLFCHCVEQMRNAGPGFPMQAAAVSLGIVCDKLHRELDRAPTTTNMADAAWSCLARQAQQGDVAAAKEILARVAGTATQKVELIVEQFGEDDHGGGGRTGGM